MRSHSFLSDQSATALHPRNICGVSHTLLCLQSVHLIISFFSYHNAENEMRSQQFQLESDLAEIKALYLKLEAQFGESQAEKQVISSPESSFPYRVHLKLVYLLMLMNHFEFWIFL